MNTNTSSSTGTRSLVLAALFVSLSFVGANIKVMGTIAFDAMPAFLGALILGPWWGAAIGALGHVLTALTSGFPLTLPIHMGVAVTMAFTMIAFYYARKITASAFGQNGSLVTAVIMGTIMNGPVSLMMISPLLVPIMGWEATVGMMIPLSIVGCVNALLAAVIYRLLPPSITRSVR